MGIINNNGFVHMDIDGQNNGDGSPVRAARGEAVPPGAPRRQGQGRRGALIENNPARVAHFHEVLRAIENAAQPNNHEPVPMDLNAD